MASSGVGRGSQPRTISISRNKSYPEKLDVCRTSVLSFLYLLFAFAFCPILRNGLGADLERTWSGLGTDLKRIRSEGETEVRPSTLQNGDFLVTAITYHPTSITQHQSPNTNRPSLIAHHQSPQHLSPNINHPTSITQHQSPITNRPSLIIQHQSPNT